MDAWFEAARYGADKVMAKLLAENPNFANQVEEGSTALHLAASHDREKVVALLLAAHPELLEKVTKDENWTALHCAASEGCDKIVAQLLAASPQSIHAVTKAKQTALHLAASNGHAKVVALILAANPDSITQVDEYGWTALHYAAKGHEGVFAKLLDACPQSLIDARDDEGSNILHLAARRSGRSDQATRILAVRPELITAVDHQGCNPVHYAVRNGNEDLAETMLEMKPEAIYAVSKSGNTVLHQAIFFEGFNKPFIAKLWQMNPQALHVENQNSKTPFDLAIHYRAQNLIELFEGSVFLDVLMDVFAEKINVRRKYGPVVNKQCESLWAFLTQDVAPIVFEYLGFVPNKPRPPRPLKRERANKLDKQVAKDKEEGEREGASSSACRYELRSRNKLPKKF